MPRMNDSSISASEVARDSARCVQCGLCLPHCPTYAHYRDENESPRGRLLLMRLLATTATDQPRARYHLSHCLHCSACEAVCPAAVEYRQLLDKTLYLQEIKNPIVTGTLAWRVGAGLLTKPAWLYRVGHLLRFYQRSKLSWLARHSGLLKALKLASIEQDLPQIPVLKPCSNSDPAVVGSRGQVMLFLGCVARVFDQQTLHDAIFLLRHAGFTVLLPQRQNCCGALHFHQGDRATGLLLAQQNIQAFGSLGSGPILTVASGCAAMLLDYGPQLATTAAQDFSPRIIDLSEFLLREVKYKLDQLVSTPLRVAVHDPCSLRNIVGQASAPYHLLSRLPGVELVELDQNTVCCGAAGIQHLIHPQLATSLRQPKLDAISRIRPDVVVTSNIGCAMHLAGGMRKTAFAVPVVHPVSLLRSRLKSESNQTQALQAP